MKSMSVGMLIVGILVSANAWAEPGARGELAVSAERLMGFSYLTRNSDESNTRITGISVFGVPAMGPFSMYNVPRTGFDYFVADGVSIGGSFSYAHTSIKIDSESAYTVDGFMLAPRVGYAFMFSEHVGLWPRGGVSYLHTWYGDADDEGSAGELALSVEAPLLLAPTENIAFAIGPTLDYGLTRSAQTTNDGITTDDDSNDPVREFGVQAGLTVFF